MLCPIDTGRYIIQTVVFRPSVPQQVSHGSEHSDPLPCSALPLHPNSRIPTPCTGPEPLSPEPLSPEHMDLAKSFASVSEDSWMI